METLEQLLHQRLAKLKALQEAQGNPYLSSFRRDGSVQEILNRFEDGKELSAAGRLTAIRSHAKTTFSDVADQTGKIQILFSETSLGENYAHAANLDLGDIIAIKGSCFITKTNERTLRVSEWHLLSKAIRPLPEKWHG